MEIFGKSGCDTDTIIWQRKMLYVLEAGYDYKEGTVQYISLDPYVYSIIYAYTNVKCIMKNN